MNSYATYTRKLLGTCCGAALAISLLTVPAKGDPWDKKTTMTVDKTIQVTNRVLPAGTYVLKLADSNSNRHIVQIFNADQSRIIDTVLAIPNYRLRPTGRSQFLFWETPAGAAPALRAWFYPGDNFGQEFAYPKHLAMLETAQTTTQNTESTRMMKQETEARRETETTTQEADRSIENEAVTEQKMTESTPPPPAEAPVEMAQATPPPAPAEPAPAPEPPRQLPKTASPYPWIGLAGMFSLSLYFALRLMRA
jgi:hypothetical protein